MESKFNVPNDWLMRKVKVLVIGAGGTGSVLLSQLAQMDYNLRQLSGNSVSLDVTVVDGDRVSKFNIGRQAFYFTDINQFKSEVLVTRFNQFVGTDWSFGTDYIKPMQVASVNCDLIITCVDSAKFRYELGMHYKGVKSKALWIDCGNDAHDGQVVMGHLGKHSNKLPNIYDLYGELLNSIEDRPEDSCSHEASIASQDFGINHAVAQQASNLLWQLLRHGSVNNHGSFINLTDSSVSPLLIDDNVWASFGYGEPTTH